MVLGFGAGNDHAFQSQRFGTECLIFGLSSDSQWDGIRGCFGQPRNRKFRDYFRTVRSWIMKLVFRTVHAHSSVCVAEMNNMNCCVKNDVVNACSIDVLT